jgi:hypothetical protein
MNFADLFVGIRCQKTEQLMLAIGGLDYMPRLPCHVLQMPAKNASGRSPPNANQVGVLRGLVSAYSQNVLNGMTQRFSGLSHALQWTLFVLRMFGIGASHAIARLRGYLVVRSKTSTTAHLDCASTAYLGAFAL